MKNSTYKCKACGIESKISHQKKNVYCSTECSAEGKLLESVERAKRGLVKERSTLRKVLTRLHGYKCSCCGLQDWNGNPIVLQVDHISGLANDNSLDNLRLICPNCHSQTKSYGGGNKGNGRKALGIQLK